MNITPWKMTSQKSCGMLRYGQIRKLRQDLANKKHKRTCKSVSTTSYNRMDMNVQDKKKMYKL